MDIDILGQIEGLLGESPVPAAVLGTDQRIHYCNRALLDLLGANGSPVGEHCYRYLQGRGPDGSPLCSPSCRRIPETLCGAGLHPQLMWCKNYTNGEALLDTYLMPLEGGNGGGDAVELLLYLFRQVDPGGEVKRVLGELAGLHQTAFRTPQVPTPIQGPRASPLSTRESEVLTLLHEGLKTREIATRLHISSATVRNHIQRILGKIKVHSRLQAVLTARRNGWI